MKCHGPKFDPDFDLDKQILKKIQKNGKLVPTLLICNLLTHPNSKLGFWAWVVVAPSHTWLSGRTLNGIHPKSPSSAPIQPHTILFLADFLQCCAPHQYKQLCNLEFFELPHKKVSFHFFTAKQPPTGPCFVKGCHFPPPTWPATIFHRFPMVCGDHVTCQI